MCYQLVELYSVCKCLYYQHAIDRCAGYGRRGHGIEKRTIYVGRFCTQHERSEEANVNNEENAVCSVGDYLDKSDSDTTSDASTELSRYPSDISLTSGTGTSRPDPNLEEDLFHKLLHFRNLRYLWPQMVEASGSQAKSHIRRFLRRFGDDLAKTSANRREKQASDFLRRSALGVAERIWEAHCSAVSLESENEIPDMLKDGHDPNEDEVVQDAGFVGEPLDYRLFYDFIFETEPIVYLEWSVREWVLLFQPSINRSLPQIIRTVAWSQWELGRESLTQATAPMNSVKLEHKCRCGQMISDSYVELKPGAVEAWKSQLLGYGAPPEDLDVKEAAELTGNRMQQSSKRGLWDMWKMLSFLRRHQPTRSLPLHDPARSTSDSYGCPQVPGPMNGTHNFVLLCLPFMQWGTKLTQPEICRLNSDQDFFRLLRSTYATARAGLSWPQLRRVSAIDFVRFEMFQNDLVDIQHKPALPTEDRRADYEFEPLHGADTLPPVGPNLLMHYFEHPEHADVVPVLFRRVPKKLRDKLTVCPVKRSSVGWGMQLAEGVSTWLLFWCGCAAFGMALAVAIGWSVARGDVQGGFAIAGFLVAFFMFCVGVGNSGML